MVIAGELTPDLIVRSVSGSGIWQLATFIAIIANMKVWSLRPWLRLHMLDRNLVRLAKVIVGR